MTATYTYCYDEAAKNAMKSTHARFVRKVQKLAPDLKITLSFNPGGIAVWGETMVKIVRGDKPVVEAFLSRDHSYIRQWDGRDSGRNIPLIDNGKGFDAEAFVRLTHELASRPFRRF